MKKTMLQTSAISLNQRHETLLSNANKFMSQGKATQAYNNIIEAMQINEQYNDLCNDNIITDNIYTIATCITYYSLKILGRGRYNPKHKTPETMYTPTNVMALKLVETFKNDVSGVVDDLKQEVYIKILQHITDGNITITDNKIELTDKEDPTAMKEILNVVQFELYRHSQRHYKHKYIVQTDDNGNDIDPTIYTLTQRKVDKIQYTENLQNIDMTKMLDKMQLTDNEKIILSEKLNMKQVERAYSDNGISKKRYESRYKSVQEISDNTSISIQTVRTCLKSIERKVKIMLDMEADENTQEKQSIKHDYIMDMVNTPTVSNNDKTDDISNIQEICNNCTCDTCHACNGLNECAYAKYNFRLANK